MIYSRDTPFWSGTLDIYSCSCTHTHTHTHTHTQVITKIINQDTCLHIYVFLSFLPSHPSSSITTAKSTMDPLHKNLQYDSRQLNGKLTIISALSTVQIYLSSVGNYPLAGFHTTGLQIPYSPDEMFEGRVPVNDVHRRILHHAKLLHVFFQHPLHQNLWVVKQVKNHLSSNR